MSAAKQIGILGGSFDPPHLGHLLAALWALESQDLDAVWFVPVARHAFAKPSSPWPVRRQLVEALIAPYRPRLDICDADGRPEATGYTYDLLNDLEAHHGGASGATFTLILGTDILADTPRWHRWPELVARWPVLWIDRGGFPLPPVGGKVNEGEVSGPKKEDGSGDEVVSGSGRDVLPAPAPRLPAISSTEIRRRVATGESLRGLVPERVAHLIARQGLYRDG